MADMKFNIEKLNGSNWQTWNIRMEMLLARDDLWDVVKNEIPVEKDRTTAWKTSDRKAKATIILLLEDSQLPLVRNLVFAHEVYLALKNFHQKTTRSIRVSLLKKLCAMNLTVNGNIEDHIRDFDDLFDRLDTAGTTLDKDTKICMLLRSLPASYDGLVTALDICSDDDISLEVVKAKLIDDYNRQQERKGSGHVKVEKAMRSAESKPDHHTTGGLRTCHYCKKPGHYKQNCRKFLANKKKEESSSGSIKAKAARSDSQDVAFTVMQKEKTSSWLIDSGASAHMTNDQSFLESLEKFDSGFITMADGKKTQIKGEGNGVLYGTIGSDKVMKIEMNDVKFVPGLSANLISVGKLAMKGLKVFFDNDECNIVNTDGAVVATGTRYCGLYYLNVAETSMAALHGRHTQDCQHQWHRRFGHRDWVAAERMLKEEMATGLRVRDCGLRMVCECCMEGKSARLPFPPVIQRKSSQVLDIVHTDICGPMQNITPSGNKYFMVIIDDFTRFTKTYLLKQKSEAVDKLKEYVRWVENLFGRKPQVVRSDGGGEFNNNELLDFYKKQGIQPQFTTPYSPQQNGVAERKNRSLTEMATCMLADAGMEKRFWGEAILTATYLQNRLPSRSIPKTPFELWWGRKPELSHLRVFGSKAYVHVPESKRKKLDSKARKLTFVGYAMDQKAYRFVDLETDKITVSRDARFIELDYETASIEVPTHTEQKKKENGIKDNTVDIEMMPFTEEKEESVDDSAEEYYEVENNEEDTNMNTRRSGRTNQGKLPKHLEHYSLGYAVEYAACAVEGPIDHRDALKDHAWREAMLEELASHQRNETSTLVSLPKGQKAIVARPDIATRCRRTS